MRVLKFGGTSVANATAMSKTLDIVGRAASQDRLVLVSSAISKCTDALIALGSLSGEGLTNGIQDLFEQHKAIARRFFTGMEYTQICEVLNSLFEDLAASAPEDYPSFGELFSTQILAKKLACERFSTLWIDSRDLIKVRDGVVDEQASYERIRKTIDAHPEIQIFVAPGFIARDEKGHVTTLGRGGSDYSAALYGAALGAQSVQIWTDVPGIMTANPKDVGAAVTMPRMSYGAAFALAAGGAKVLYTPTVAPVRKKGIDLEICNTFYPEGLKTIVSKNRCEQWVGVASRAIDAEKSLVSVIADFDFDKEAAESKTFSALQKAGIRVANVKAGSKGVEVALSSGLEKLAVKCLHKEFFEQNAGSATNIYLAGQGAVGRALLDLIEAGGKHIEKKTGKKLCIAGISRHHSEDEVFFAKMLREAPRHSVFVDATDSETIYRHYPQVLEAGIDIVSSNRRSLSVPLARYNEIKSAALRSGAFLRYETTVGASLPILENLSRCANSSDEILSLEAVVSCSLNRILTSGEPFEKALESAQAAGLMEKDPSADLCGRDALRKLLILAREAGVDLEENDVEVVPVRGDEHFEKGSRFVASLVKDPSRRLGYSARIALQTVDETHPAYGIQGTENIIILRSEYHRSPLVIRGSGEGAKQAASSILNDILR